MNRIDNFTGTIILLISLVILALVFPIAPNQAEFGLLFYGILVGVGISAVGIFVHEMIRLIPIPVSKEVAASFEEVK